MCINSMWLRAMASVVQKEKKDSGEPFTYKMHLNFKCLGVFINLLCTKRWLHKRDLSETSIPNALVKQFQPQWDLCPFRAIDIHVRCMAIDCIFTIEFRFWHFNVESTIPFHGRAGIELVVAIVGHLTQLSVFRRESNECGSSQREPIDSIWNG